MREITFTQKKKALVIFGCFILAIIITFSWYYLRALNSGLEPISRRERLYTTMLGGTGVSDGSNITRSLRGIERFRNLEILTIWENYPISEFRRLNRLPNLHTLRFGYHTLPGMSLTQVGGRRLRRRLRRLDIVGYRLELAIQNINGIESFRNLERLELPNNRASVGGASIHFPVLDEPLDITGIENLTNLRILNISGNRLSNLNELRNLTNLTHLNASNNELTDISALRGLTNLERVDLSGNRLSEQELRNNLPEHLINRPGGEEWLQRQIESQNPG